MSTQTTLQNIEIYRIGDTDLNGPTTPAPTVDGSPTPPFGGSSNSSTPVQAKPATAPTNQNLGLLVDHQNAVVMKFIKDQGGTIDLVTRSKDDAQIVRTDGVTLDALADQFNFRVPTTKAVGA
jgi:hypothetical protein